MGESGRVRYAKGLATLVYNSANPNRETNPNEVYGRPTLLLKSGLFLGLKGNFFFSNTVQQGKGLFKGNTKSTFSKSFT